MTETRENYRETAVAGTDLLLKAWTEGQRMMTVLSWPPHGIERPLGITLTLSQAEVDLLASCWASEMTPEASDLLVHISGAVLVQCVLLRKLQDVPGVTFKLPALQEVKP
jgi:hypothetical protein